MQTPWRLQLTELVRVSSSGQTPTCGPSSAGNWKITNPKAKQTLSRSRVTRIPILPKGKTLSGRQAGKFLRQKETKTTDSGKAEPLWMDVVRLAECPVGKVQSGSSAQLASRHQGLQLDRATFSVSKVLVLVGNVSVSFFCSPIHPFSPSTGTQLFIE